MTLNPDGTMPLMEHLRELQSRLIKIVLAILVGVIVAWYFFDPLYEFLSRPYNTGIAAILEERGLQAERTVNGVGGAFSFQLKLSLMAGILASSPIWVWQIWSFVLPALHRHERKWALLLTAIGVPLFLGGVVVGYLVLPKAIEVLIGFTPNGVTSLLTLGDYLDFVIRMLLVFGVSAQIPLVVVMLNRLGIVSAKQLVKARPYTVIGIFIFAAIATPSTDPLTMLFLAAPMTVLYFISELIAHLTDRKKKRLAGSATPDDEASLMDLEHFDDDNNPSPL
ncbi:twin-arginine translocase subunit TatC [soil metagenome]